MRVHRSFAFVDVPGWLHHVVGVVSGPVETVSIRSGVHAGEVILMEGDDYIGHDVRGSVVLFCPPGCLDTWRRRPPRPGPG